MRSTQVPAPAAQAFSPLQAPAPSVGLAARLYGRASEGQPRGQFVVLLLRDFRGRVDHRMQFAPKRADGGHAAAARRVEACGFN
eukprot:5915914-Prymnesium_polylepis.2